MIISKEIKALETYSVRYTLLREGKPMESCDFEGDLLQSTIHIWLYNNAALIGVTSLFKTKNPELKSDNQIQIRGMAVLIYHQNRGYGLQLIIETEVIANNNNCKLLWFNARKKAVGFYEKMNYKIIGEPFNVGDIGTHFVMYKKLT
jgi:predicted GNAT family N-acyltransferase